MRYFYPDASDALSAKTQFLREHHRYAKHCFQNNWGAGYIIFDTKEEVNLWWKEHTGRYFYDAEYESGTIFTETDALREIEDSYGKIIDNALLSRDFTLPTLAIGLPFSSRFGNRLFIKFSKSFEEEDISYRFYDRYHPIFLKTLGVNNADLRRRVIKLLYEYFYESRFKKRIDGSNQMNK